MQKIVRSKVNHIVWLIIFIIMAIVAVTLSVKQGEQLQQQETKNINYYLPKDENKYNIRRYGSTKYYPRQDTIIFTAKPKIAKGINNTKFNNYKPIKINYSLKKLSHQIKKQAKIPSIKMVLKAQHQRYIIEEK